jgi:hypothetical protein
MRRIHLAFLVAGVLFSLMAGHIFAGEFIVETPQTGNLSQRVKMLWETTRPIIEKDARANLTDEDYQARRTPLFTAWVNLQAVPDEKAAVTPETMAGISRIIPRILELIDHVYGFPGFSKEERERKRQNLGRTNYLIKDINEKMKIID